MTSMRAWLGLLLIPAACGGDAGLGDDGDDVPVCCDAAVDSDGTVIGPDGGPDGGVPPDADPTCVATGDEIYGDGVDNDCDGYTDEPAVCMSGGQAFTSIAAAIAVAPDGATIDVCGGTYHETLAITDRSVRLRGTGAASTILDADSLGTAVSIANGHSLTIEGITIREGHADTGAGVRCVDASLTVKQSTFTANRAEVGGGGIYGQRCTVDISESLFEANHGGDLGGGAGLFDTSTGTIADSTMTNNNAHEGGALYLVEGAVDVLRSHLDGNIAEARGGALYQKSDGLVADSTLNNNSSGWTGGGVYIWQHAPRFERITVDGNYTAWEGGGFYIHQGSTTITDSVISNNKAVDDGGGVRLFETASRLERNRIANNESIDGDGGGFKISHWHSEFIDNDLVDNKALGAGGGAELDNDSSQFIGGSVTGNDASIGGGIHVMLWPYHGGVIQNVRIADNHAHRGGGLYIENSWQPVKLQGLLVDNNDAFEGAGVYTRGAPTELTNSIVRNNTASGVGGGFFSHPSSRYPWTKACPCPPIDPPALIKFNVFYGNTGDSGQAAYIGSPHLTFSSNILAGHDGTAVEVAPTPEPPPPDPNPDPTVPPPPPEESRVPTWLYNDTYPATFVGMSTPTGRDGNIASNPAFLAPATGDFHLGADSACADKGDPGITDADGTRADMGAYGGPTPMP